MVAPNPSTSSVMPEGFVLLGKWGQVSEVLGYPGTARFVGWYWEPCGDELSWFDGRTGLCGASAWYRWVRAIAPVLRHLGYHCGDSDDAARVWLVCDGQTDLAYVVYPWLARDFLRRQWDTHGAAE